MALNTFKCNYLTPLHSKGLSRESYKSHCRKTFPLRTAWCARWTQCWTLAEMQRYLKKRWWADQNWPHIDLRMRCSASIRFAAASNFSRASTHWRHDNIQWSDWKHESSCNKPVCFSALTLLVWSCGP